MTNRLNYLPIPALSDVTLVDILSYRAKHQSDRLAYEYLQDREKIQLTYKELAQKAQAIATELHRQGLTGERVLLLYPAGLDFISAFFGCLYAVTVAVPVYPPRRNQKLSRLQSIVADCSAQGILTTSNLAEKIQAHFSASTTSLKYILTDTVTATVTDYKIAKPKVEQLAFLQYTSGSTGTPKGVMVTNRNLIHNSELLKTRWELTEKSRFVSWLPSYHDMGLIAGILQPLYGGFPGTLISPTDFLRRPILWLETISECRATISGAPNFAYEICVEKITPEAKQNLDLSSWDVAFNGAEPIRAETLRRFAEAFKDCGFNYKALYPCYGMAEATLMISGGLKALNPVVKEIDTELLQQNLALEIDEHIASETKVSAVVSSGTVKLSQEMVIVNPDTRKLCQDEYIGEIWVKVNESIPPGYWNRPEITAETFQANLVGQPEPKFLRTGDLGFIQDGELFVTGRKKNVIIIRGRNYYPQDIEKTVEQAHPGLKLSSNAAFSIEVDRKEHLVVVQEVKRTYLRKLNIEEVEDAIRSSISEQHGLQLYDLALIRTSSIPKTSSGKIQHYLCRQQYLDNSLKVIKATKQVLSSQNKLEELEQPNLSITVTTQSIQNWLTQWLSNKLQIPFAQIDRAKSFADYGLDSVMAIELAEDLSAWLPNQQNLEATIAWNFPSIDALVEYLVEFTVGVSGAEEAGGAEVQGCRGAEVQRSRGAEEQGCFRGAGELQGQREIDLEALSEEELARSLLEEIALAKGRRING